MKNWMFLLFLTLPVLSSAQIVTTYAGGGTGGGTDGLGDGLHCDSAKLFDPTRLTFDRLGNLYIAGSLANNVRKIDTAGIITLVAGNGSATYNGDSILAVNAGISEPQEIAIDSSGNIYIPDDNHRIRKVNAITGMVTTIAGIGAHGFSGDNGPATAAMLSYPNAVCLDRKGNIFISDEGNARIRKIDTSGIITTVVGNGVMENAGDGNLAIAASIEGGCSIILDDTGNLYIAEGGVGAERIRKVDTMGIIHTIAGTGNTIYNGDNIPAIQANIDPDQITFDNSGNLVLSDFANNVVRRIDAAGIIHTIAGDTVMGNTGDGGPADSAEFDGLGGVAVDRCGNIYASQVNNPRIRKVTFNPTCSDTTISVTNITNNQTINIYPNPAYNTITIKSNTPISSVSVINLLGQTVYINPYSSGQVMVNIAHLPAGLYFVKVNEQYVQQVVKE